MTWNTKNIKEQPEIRPFTPPPEPLPIYNVDGKLQREAERQNGTRGRAAARVASTTRLPPEDWAVLRAHAYQRNVTVNRLVEDIIRCYLVYITDFSHPYFTPQALGFPPLTVPQNSKPGYLESLGFVEPTGRNAGDTSIAPPPPPMRQSDHNDATPEREEDREFLDYDRDAVG